MIYLLNVKPFESSFFNKLELVNEASVLAIVYLSLAFTDLELSRDV